MFPNERDKERKSVREQERKRRKRRRAEERSESIKPVSLKEGSLWTRGNLLAVLLTYKGSELVPSLAVVVMMVVALVFESRPG